jgi:hypothetical protein
MSTKVMSVGWKRKARSIELPTSKQAVRTGQNSGSKPWNPHNEETLCDNCQEIDLKTAFKQPLNRYKETGVAIANLGSRTKAWNKSSCTLCRLFAAVSSLSEDSKSYHLRAMSFIQATRHSEYYKPRTYNGDAICLVVVPGDKNCVKDKRSLRKNIRYCRTTGCILPVHLSSSTNRSRYQARLMNAECIDYDFVRQCLDFCQRRHNHHEMCKITNVSSPSSIKVIDCESLSVIPAPPGCSYVALSYVWGPNDSEVPLKFGTGTSLPRLPPKVIRDAIALTRNLNWRYLWVDKYCINQLDEKVKKQQIGQMGKIYGAAALTIVAAAGSDAHSGLPGVSNSRRRPQASAHVQGRLLAETFPLPEYSIHKSKWATRGWTYQEGVLSTRRLVFTEEQVFFECKTMSCCEAISTPLVAIHKGMEFGKTVKPGYFEGFAEFSPYPRFNLGSRGFTGLGCFAKHVERFTARELTYPSDGLNAIMGILDNLGNENMIYHHWGLPINFKGNPPTPDVFACSLLWTHKPNRNQSPPTRKKEFPSFCWAGWLGVATLQIHYIVQCDFQSNMTFLTGPEDMEPLQFNQVNHSLSGVSDIVEASQYLYIECAVIKISFDNSYGHAKFGHAWQSIPEGALQLPRHELAEQKEWECLVVGTDFLEAFLMLIKWHGDIAERGGIIMVYNCEFCHSVERASKHRRRIKLG